MKYLSYVDGLRAIAVAAVVAFHVWPAAIGGGYAGVDVFFVISGFLITRLIVGEVEGGSFSLLGFWMRRARRLLPAAFVCFLAIAVLGYFILLPDTYREFGASLAAASLMYANLYFARRSGYFDAPPDALPLLHTWSLSVEDQFYVVWPLLLLALLPLLSRRLLAIVIAIAAAASFAWAQAELANDPARAFFLIQSRAGELLIGALVALTAPQLRISKALAEAASAVGLAVVLASFIVLDANTPFPGLSALPVCIATALVIAAGYHHETLATRTLSLGPLVFLGLISYSLYLWHWPLLVLARYAAERPLAIWEGGGVILAAGVIAALSWKYVEQPFRHRRAGTPPVSMPEFLRKAAVPLAVLALCGVAIRYGDGWPWRYEARAQALFKQASSGNPLRSACDGYENVFRNDEFCNFGRRISPDRGYDLAVIGDSMADHWVPAVADYALRSGLAGRQVTNGGCPALLGDFVVDPHPAKDRSCRDYRAALIAFLDANPSVRTLIMSGHWSKWLHQIDSREPGRFATAMADTLRQFRARGLDVLIIDQVPVYDELPMRCVASSLSRGGDINRCELPITAAWDQVKISDDIIGRLIDPANGIYFTSPRFVMCEQQSCNLIEDEIFLYRDQSHLSGIGARHLGTQIDWPKFNPRHTGAVDPADQRIVR